MVVFQLVFEKISEFLTGGGGPGLGSGSIDAKGRCGRGRCNVPRLACAARSPECGAGAETASGGRDGRRFSVDVNGVSVNRDRFRDASYFHLGIAARGSIICGHDAVHAGELKSRTLEIQAVITLGEVEFVLSRRIGSGFSGDVAVAIDGADRRSCE